MSTLIAISGLGFVCLLLEILNLRKILIPVTLAGLLAALGITLYEYCQGASLIDVDNHNMIVSTGYSQIFSSLFIVLTTFIVAMSSEFYKDKISKITDYVAIKIFMLAGAIAMVSFGNFAMFFIGIEILSIAAYVLAASEPNNIKSNEAGAKYFIMGAFASSFILFGIALIYGSFGSFNIEAISLASVGQSANLPIWFTVGFLMLITGLMFKASIVPFHFWAPDVYEGSPTLVTAAMSTLVKVAAVGALYKILVILSAAISPSFEWALMTLCVLTLFVGNITAIKQTNIKRMLAYSGISHTGFMMMALIALDAPNTIIYYATAYGLAGIAAFAVILGVCKDKKNEDISNFFGLLKQQPLMAIILSCALLSLGGIPIFAGFFAKLFVFNQMLQLGHVVIVVIGIINSVIAVYYYLGVVNVMITKERPSDSISEIPMIYKIVAVSAILLNIVLGIFPSIIMGLEL